jgi:hypothetical protein
MLIPGIALSANVILSASLLPHLSLVLTLIVYFIMLAPVEIIFFNNYNYSIWRRWITIVLDL